MNDFGFDFETSYLSFMEESERKVACKFCFFFIYLLLLLFFCQQCLSSLLKNILQSYLFLTKQFNFLHLIYFKSCYQRCRSFDKYIILTFAIYCIYTKFFKRTSSFCRQGFNINFPFLASFNFIFVCEKLCLYDFLQINIFLRYR